MNAIQRLCLCVAVAAVWTVAHRAVAQAPVGAIEQSTLLPDGLAFTLTDGSTGSARLIDSGMLRLTVVPTDAALRATGAVLNDPPLDGAPFVVDTGASIAIAGGALNVLIDRDPFRVLVFNAQGEMLLGGTQPQVTIDPDGLIAAAFISRPEESYFGLGQRGGPIDRRGRAIVFRNTDEFDYGEFTDPHYQSFPFLVGLNDAGAYGVFLDVPAFSYFDLDSGNTGVMSLGAVSGALDVYVFAGPRMADVLERYTRLTGRPMLPPRWTFGYHHCRYGWMTREEVLGIAQELRARSIPCDSMWLDIDYMRDFHHFTWDPARFPDPGTMNQQLLGDGFRTVYINEPCFVLDDPLYAELESEVFFLRNTFDQTQVNEIFLGEVSWIDFSKALARQWYEDRLQAFLSMGVTALWNDLNEPAANTMPFAIHDFDGDPRLDEGARNIYALLENEMTTAAQLRLRPNTRPWNLSRSGFSGLQRTAATWSGDTASSFDALRVSVQMSASMGLSGLAQFGHDVGGFLGSPDAELFIRWLEFSCFTTFLRNHSVNTADPREPWVYGEPFTSMIRERIETRYRWLPTIYTLAERANRTGEPALAPMIFHDTHDPALRGVDDQFMLGRDVLVAPVVESGVAARDVYLPTGSDWYELETGARFDGGRTVTAAAPLGTIPLFVRAGSILVLGEPMAHVGAPHDPTLTVRLFPGPDASFTLYEDDGETFDYAIGEFKRTRFKAHSVGFTRVLRVNPGDGTYQPSSRGASLIFEDVRRPPVRVTANGVPVPESDGGVCVTCWTYDSPDRRLLVWVSDLDAEQTIRAVFGSPKSDGVTPFDDALPGSPAPQGPGPKPARAPR